MSNELWKDIFFYAILGWLFVYFTAIAILKRMLRKNGKSCKDIELKVFLWTFLPIFGFVSLIEPDSSTWVTIIFVGLSAVVPIIAWRVYVRNFNNMRRRLGLREWDWDRGGPMSDKNKPVDDERKEKK